MPSPTSPTATTTIQANAPSEHHANCSHLPENALVLRPTAQLQALLTIIRDWRTGRADFVFTSDRIIRLLVEEGLNHLPTKVEKVITPLGKEYTGVGFQGRICGVSIMRAGEAMESGLRDCCRSVRIGKILIQRDEATAKPKLFYAKLPEDIAERWCLLLDPMLATGGSAMQAIEVLLSHGVDEGKILFLNLISSPEGLKAVCEKYPKLRVITAWIDQGLDEKKYIVPGLGDFGDRYFDAAASRPPGISTDDASSAKAGKSSSGAVATAIPIKSLVREAEVGVQAVLRACHLTSAVQSTLTVDETVTKPDKSPVTVADLSAQSLISLHLLKFFPEDKIVGEEDTTELRANKPLCDKVVSLVVEGFAKSRSETEGEWAEDHSWTPEEVLTAIDAGSALGGPTGRSWTIDPIDGTLGFLRKQQFAVCLALIVDGVVELGILACPNLGSGNVDDDEKGVLFLARRGEGSWSRSLKSSSWTRLNLPATSSDSNPLRFLESVEAGHSAHDVQARIGEILGVHEGTSLRMDSQAKYGCLGRGEGGVYLRIPTKYTGGEEYAEKIWDHASGSLLITESGGLCTDMHGKPLDFSIGRTLKANEGIVAAGRETHAKALNAVRVAIEEAGQRQKK